MKIFNFFKKSEQKNNQNIIGEPRFSIGEKVWEVWFDREELTSASQKTIHRILFNGREFEYSYHKTGDYFYNEKKFITINELLVIINQEAHKLRNK